MTSPIQERAVVEISQTVQNNRDIMSNILAFHGLTGCDTVAPLYGIGNKTGLQIFKASPGSLSKLGNMDAQLNELLQEATTFMAIATRIAIR